jgi:hypothetical protein
VETKILRCGNCGAPLRASHGSECCAYCRVPTIVVPEVRTPVIDPSPVPRPGPGRIVYGAPSDLAQGPARIVFG